MKWQSWHAQKKRMTYRTDQRSLYLYLYSSFGITNLFEHGDGVIKHADTDATKI